MEEIKTEETSLEKVCEELLKRSKANGVALERMGKQILALQNTIERMQNQRDYVKQGRPKTLTLPSDSF